MAWIALLKYWRYAAAAAALIIVSTVVLNYGKTSFRKGKAAGVAQTQAKVDKANATIAAMEKAAHDQAAKHAEQMAKASQEYQTLKAEREQKERVQYVEVQKIVEKPVYRSVCIDDGGLSELNRAIKGK